MKQSIIFLMAVFFFFSAVAVCPAQIYKYKDENGNWAFTDSPPAGVENMESMGGVIEHPAVDTDITSAFQNKFRPKTPVENASLATVTIQTPAGSGSGFFISPKGYIITNKHVIRGSAREIERSRKKFTKADQQIRTYEKYIIDETAQLDKIEAYLSEYKSYLDGLGNSALKKRETINYTLAVKDYETRKASFEKKRREFSYQKKAYQDQKSDFNLRNLSARTAKTVTIILKDGSRHRAYLVALSKKYDLALLKLNSLTTPYLTPLHLGRVYQGMPVYAIGSPIGLKDSVSSGIVSGIELGYIKTNAQIYPGNSGGPLVAEKGNIIGINTMKQLTRNFEGLGFAIPIEVALREFDALIDR